MKYGNQAKIRESIAERGINISRGHLSNVFAGRKRCSYPLARALSDILGTSVDIWMDGKLPEIVTAIAAHDRDRDNEEDPF